MTRRLLVFAFLVTASTTLHAGILNYTATLGCFNGIWDTCVTVNLAWAEPVPVQFAEVDSSSGQFLFNLVVNPPFRFLGAITPNPQTVSNLPQFIANIISNGQATPGITSIGVASNVFADLNLFDSEHHLIDSTIFIATAPGVQAIPEPATWGLVAICLALLALWKLQGSRNVGQNGILRAGCQPAQGSAFAADPRRVNNPPQVVNLPHRSAEHPQLEKVSGAGSQPAASRLIGTRHLRKART